MPPVVRPAAPRASRTGRPRRRTRAPDRVGRPERWDPPSWLIEIALDYDCRFAINTDAHAPGQLDFLDYGAERAAANGVPAERIVTTWPVDELLAWSHAKR